VLLCNVAAGRRAQGKRALEQWEAQIRGPGFVENSDSGNAPKEN
jgi:hypothetical protein